MPRVKLVPVKPPREEATVLAAPPGSSSPLIKGEGNGDVDLLCGSCSFVIGEGLDSAGVAAQLIFLCPRCGRHNASRT